MFGILLLVFIVVPVVELYVIVQVAGGIGILETLAVLFTVSVVGASLVRRQGMSVIAKIQRQLANGAMPGKELVDGGLVLFAGALLLTPGFVTDSVGLLLLFPLTRLPIRAWLQRRFRGRVQTFGFPGAGSAPQGGRWNADPDIIVIDDTIDPQDLGKQ